MQVHPIHTEQDYQKALARIEEIFDAKPGTPRGDELEVLGMLVEQYEKEAFPIDPPSPVEAIKFRMEQLGMTQSDLAKLLGSRSRASEILTGRRALSLRQVRLLSKRLGVSADILIDEAGSAT